MTSPRDTRAPLPPHVVDHEVCVYCGDEWPMTGGDDWAESGCCQRAAAEACGAEDHPNTRRHWLFPSRGVCPCGEAMYAEPPEVEGGGA